MMFRTGLSRRLIALVAAYGLALQAMFAAVVVAAPGAAFASVICAPGHHWSPAGTRDTPASGHGCDCPFCPLVGAAALPSAVATMVRIYGAAAPMPPWRFAAPARPFVSRAGLARAPPA
jgi:hypothetical protein